jgi:MoxR-like ATPase
MPSDVVGVNFFNQKSSEFEFLPGPIVSQVLLADEINRATPRTQSALLEAMQERQASIDGVTFTLPDPFIVMATLNPIEMEGTFPLPEAQLDRFMVRLTLGYPSLEEEADIYLRFERDSTPPVIEAVTDGDEIRRMQDMTPTVRIEEPVRDYIIAVVRGTRDHVGISLGASPRAGMALYKATQAWAAIDGRDFVTPDDVKTMAPAVLPHRTVLSSSARLRGDSPEQVVDDVLSSVPVPIEG